MSLAYSPPAGMLEGMLAAPAASQALAGLAGVFGANRAMEVAAADRQDSRAMTLLQYQLQRDAAQRADAERTERERLAVGAQDRAMNLAREQSAFGQLNASLDRQLKIAEFEAGERDRAFQRSLQMVQNTAQARVQALQLRELEGTLKAKEMSGSIEAFQPRLVAALNSGEHAEVARVAAEAEAAMKDPAFAFLDAGTKERLLTVATTSASANSGVKKLSPDRLGEEYAARDLPDNLAAVSDSKLRVEHLQFASLLKQTISGIGDGRVTRESLDAAIGRMYGDTPTAQKLRARLLAPGSLETTIQNVSSSPGRPLSGDSLSRWALLETTRQRQLDELSADPNVPTSVRRAAQALADVERMEDYYSVSGAPSPEMAAAENMKPGIPVLVGRYFDYGREAAGKNREWVVGTVARTRMTALQEAVLNRFDPAKYPESAVTRKLDRGELETAGRSMVGGGFGPVGVLRASVEAPAARYLGVKQVADDVYARLSRVAELQDELNVVATRGYSITGRPLPEVMNELTAEHQAIQSTIQQIAGGPAPRDLRLTVSDLVPRSLAPRVEAAQAIVQARGQAPGYQPPQTSAQAYTELFSTIRDASISGLHRQFIQTQRMQQVPVTAVPAGQPQGSMRGFRPE